MHFGRASEQEFHQGHKGHFPLRRNAAALRAHYRCGAHAGEPQLVHRQREILANWEEILRPKCRRGPGDGRRLRVFPDGAAQIGGDGGGYGGAFRGGELRRQKGVENLAGTRRRYADCAEQCDVSGDEAEFG